MKKIWILIMLFAFGLSSFAQLRVANNFGQGLNVENGGKVIFIPSNGVATFQTRVRTAVLSCWTSDNKIKFVVSKSVSRAGLVKIEVSDGANVVIQTNPTTTYNNTSNVVIDTPITSSENPQSLKAILNGSNESVIQSVQSTTISSNSQTISQTSTTRESVIIEYSGSRTLKIISGNMNGLELIGKNDSSYSASKNKYNILVSRNVDLVLGVVEKKQSGQAIWPYGEIRKNISQNDQVCKITDADIKMMCTSENRKVKFKVDAPGYKILIETDAGDIISLGDKATSKMVDGPIGQSYVRIAYTDANGEFHPTAFMPIHITSQDRYIIINQNSLKKTLVISNF